jgi:ABC-type nitrate/sulfonate/bicarbonate transport system permease component
LAAFFRANERLIIGAGSLALFLVLWEIISRSGLVDPLFISSPVRVTAGGQIAAQIGSREHGAQRIDSVHAAPFHAREILL